MLGAKMDSGILDELIGLCEKRMSDPFKKKKEAMVVAVEPGEEEMEGEEEGEMDVEDLVEALKMMKG